jgi:two-component system, NtrC family, response regulator HupR/HoxA
MSESTLGYHASSLQEECRGERPRLYVPVETWPALGGCWAVRLGERSLDLLATPREGELGPRQGELLELSLTLPEARARLRLRGEVRWRQDVREPEGGTVAALEVALRNLGEPSERLLARTLLPPPCVALVYAEPEEARTVRALLEGHALVRQVGAGEDVEALLGRGDVFALLVGGRDEARAVALVEHLSARRAEQDPSGVGPASDLAPRILYCAPASPARLVELFNAGKILRVLPPPLVAGPLIQAVAQARRERGVRTEQRWLALQLERSQPTERPAAPPRLRVEPPLSAQALPEAGYRSPAMQRVLELARVAAPHRVAVLLQGETGTGKELLARVLHRLSERRHAPLVVQDCGALTETLLESELFGHVRGAFTGAVADHPGLFVLADGGTIFLDEVENTTPNLQSKLLRALESGEVRPVGGTQVRRVDVRVIAASNRDLAEEVRAGRFRSDLYYRLNGFTIDLPPLRERPEDVLDLACHFLETFCRALGRPPSALSEEARQLLQAARWSGNVRELRNVLERAVLLCAPGEPVSRQHLPPSLVASAEARLAARAPRAGGAGAHPRGTRAPRRRGAPRCRRPGHGPGHPRPPRAPPRPAQQVRQESCAAAR